MITKYPKITILFICSCFLMLIVRSFNYTYLEQYHTVIGFNLEQLQKTNGYKKIEIIINKDNFHNHAKGISDDLIFQKEIPSLAENKINCSALFAGDQNEQKKADSYHKQLKPSKPSNFTQLSSNCSHFIQSMKFIVHPVSKEEEDFPIAFSVLMYKDPDQAVRLLRAIYRPQNYYCIHVDKKSAGKIHEDMAGVARCFPNVFIASKKIDVVWGTFTNLSPELLCMKDLWKHKAWKYFINLTGQEFPLKTNWDIVKILKAYNGSNDVSGSITNIIKDRFRGQEKHVPHHIKLTKGTVLIAVKRNFVDYVLHNQTAKDFLEWTKKTLHPDETFFTTLNHNPQLRVPGSHTGEPDSDPSHHLYMVKFRIWYNGSRQKMAHPCSGRIAHNLCIFGTRELPMLASRPEMFVNKFHWDYEPLAYSCMEELIFQRTKEEVEGLRVFNTSLYESMDFVRNHVT